ncbi:MAG: FKBP-type peptidyl-prolyl cis-trans isomerase [Candidatus Vecturithrix sp.]|jgi:FKBP-type peptidyl-prolyl cis-trans isomerase 2|nr:FKBP-type peptidyl-prolyl cis-trans isomerase [Candidatus Vecturithrix sp.]
MVQAKDGDTVKVHYTGRLDDGTIFDSSQNRDPLQFTLGTGSLLADFESNVIGMCPREVKTFTIVSENAYGQHRDDMVVAIDRHQVPEHLDLQVNQQLQLVQEDGQSFVVQVTGLSESTVTLDANHPLAGQDLTFEIELMEIV